MADDKERKPVVYVPAAEWEAGLDVDGDIDSKGRVVVMREMAVSQAVSQAKTATKH